MLNHGNVKIDWMKLDHKKAIAAIIGNVLYLRLLVNKIRQKKLMLKFLQKLSNTENYIVIAITYLLL